jgi:hypothetical protein
MIAKSEPGVVAGPAGALQCALHRPEPGTTPRGLAVICHPNPVQGGTMDNKVAVTLARALVAIGYTAVRFNFRGVGESAGQWDEGRGEVDDALAVIAAHRGTGQPLVLAGFSFGGYVAVQAAERLGGAAAGIRLALVAPAASRFAMSRVASDTLVVHGEADDVVPLSAVLDWARAQMLPIVVVPGTGHFFHGQLTLLKQILTAALAARAS